jgi:hypothetical protein
MNDRVTMKDIRAAGMCAAGVRAFCERHNLDYYTLRKEGIPLTTVENLGDALALKVVEVIRGRK